MSNFESWKIRHVSPDTIKSSHNLDKMQENLLAAAHTIEALKLERERLKQSIKLSATQPDDSDSVPHELENLRALLHSKETLITKLKNQLATEKITKSGLNTETEYFAKMRSELKDKEKYINSLEKLIKDLKAELLSHISLRDDKKNEEISQMMGEMQDELKELREEKKKWNKVKEVILGVTGEFIKTSTAWNRGRNDWDLLMEALNSMRITLEEKEKTIKELKILKQTSQLHKPGLLFALTEACSKFLHQVHKAPAPYALFQSHFKTSSFLRDQIEKKDFSEALLKLFLFSTDLLTNNNSVPDSKPTKESRPTLIRSAPKEKPASEKPRFFSPSVKTLNQPTQTPEKCVLSGSKSNKCLQTSYELVNKESRPLPKSSRTTDTISKKQQKAETGQIVKVFEKNQEIAFKNAETSTVKPEVMRIESLHTDEDKGYIKLFDESDRLLTIIDKQHSRLAKLNSRITNLVPEAVESEVSSESEESKAYLTNFPETRPLGFQDGTFNKRENPLHRTESAKINTGVVKYQETKGKKHANSPKAEVKFKDTQKGSDDYETYLKQARIMGTGFEGVEIVDDSRFLHSSGTENALESSKHSKEPIFEYKGDSEEGQRFFTVQPVNEKSPKSVSPSQLSHPKSKNEDFWYSAADYFSSKREESQ